MPVTTFVADDLFTVRVFKQHINNPDRVWANNYEFKAKGGGGASDVAALLAATYEFELAFHTIYVRLIRVSASTWEADSVPYDPLSFMSIPLNDLGTISETGEDLVALNTCMRVNRVPESGRFGQLYYRGCLFENDIEAPSGANVMHPGSGAESAFEAAIASGSMADILTGSDATWDMVMVNSDGTQVRRVNALLLAGVSTVPMNHTWFNRTPA